jgi:hypothetical protein
MLQTFGGTKSTPKERFNLLEKTGPKMYFTISSKYLIKYLQLFYETGVNDATG